jgi:hypothetical protein
LIIYIQSINLDPFIATYCDLEIVLCILKYYGRVVFDFVVRDDLQDHRLGIILVSIYPQWPLSMYVRCDVLVKTYLVLAKPSYLCKHKRYSALVHVNRFWGELKPIYSFWHLENFISPIRRKCVFISIRQLEICVRNACAYGYWHFFYNLSFRNNS